MSNVNKPAPSPPSLSGLPDESESWLEEGLLKTWQVYRTDSYFCRFIHNVGIQQCPPPPPKFLKFKSCLLNDIFEFISSERKHILNTTLMCNVVRRWADIWQKKNEKEEVIWQDILEKYLLETLGVYGSKWMKILSIWLWYPAHAFPCGYICIFLRPQWCLFAW